MEIERSKVILVSDFKCCQKYKHTLPSHVELIGGEENETVIGSLSSSKSVVSTADSVRPASSFGYNGVGSLSGGGSIELEDLEQMDENVEDEIMEMESEVAEEESGDELSVCSDWIVLKQRKKKREKVQEESSAVDVKEPASPEGEDFESVKPDKLIPSGFFKYKDFCKELPKTPPLEDEALRKRAPSPNSSMPRSDVGMYETRGEDWIWFEGRYLEGGTWEVAAGENGEYYRMQKQWKEGHWEPSPWLVEKWEREELELEKERLREMEEKRKYDEILKREDSPGMDIMNWGYGPVKLTRWKEVLGGISIQDFSALLTESLSHKFLEEASEMTMGAIEEMSSQLSEAMMENSFEMVRDILASYFSEDLAAAISENMILNSAQNTVAPGESQMSQEEEAREASDNSLKRIVEVEVECDVIPEDFRNLLLGFARQFVDDLPQDPLQYAITYFEDRIPRYDLIDEEDEEDVSNISLMKLTKRRKCFIEPSAYSVDVSNCEKTEAQVALIVKALYNCWLLRGAGVACYNNLMREMYRLPVCANTSIRTLEDDADHMYVIESGTFQLSNKYETIVLKDQGSFGELSLIGLNMRFPYDAVAVTDGVLWCLPKLSFLNNKRKINMHRARLVAEMMVSLELFDNLEEEEFYRMLNCVELEYYQKGDVLFCEDTRPLGIYFILFGDVKLIKMHESITKTKAGKTKTVKKLKVIGSHSSPHILGHDNVISGKRWEYYCVARSYILEVALLKSDAFERVVGDVQEVMNRPVREISSPREASGTSAVIGEDEVYGEYGEGDEAELYEGEGEEGTAPKTEVIRKLPPTRQDIDFML